MCHALSENNAEMVSMPRIIWRFVKEDCAVLWNLIRRHRKCNLQFTVVLSICLVVRYLFLQAWSGSYLSSMQFLCAAQGLFLGRQLWWTWENTKRSSHKPQSGNFWSSQLLFWLVPLWARNEKPHHFGCPLGFGNLGGGNLQPTDLSETPVFPEILIAQNKKAENVQPHQHQRVQESCKTRTTLVPKDKLLHENMMWLHVWQQWGALWATGRWLQI